ncbi:MAG: 30S ribosomal protein S4 [Parcubacteria group bacterium 21-54-25]|nr:MAG: 30S ribosomal protein S4 [Parcubacteria group bacterium 21-54-25]HQU07821.1 30S ribosomal protein S4 [Candidatus Paceibacterota bacterium]
MKTGPRYKIAKRLGASVFEKAQTQKFAIAQERTAKQKRRGRGPSDYGKQLLEKQKVRVTYGVTERQFSGYVRKAIATTHGANPAELLHRALELRLDNIAYRLGLAPTRRAARQMAAHGHLAVNGRRTTIPSRQVRSGDRVSVREGSKSRALFTDFAERFMERQLPSWLSWNPKTMEGGVQEVPTTSSTEPAGDLTAVISFYSR